MNKISSSGYSHRPVLLKEITKLFEVNGFKFIIDCTIGEGGHSEFFLESFLPEVFVIGIERDPKIYEIACSRLGKFAGKVSIFNGSFSNLDEYLRLADIRKPVTGILFDLGISSYHVEFSGKGFSFSRDEPLDMRFNPEEGISAYEVVNGFPPEELADIFFEFGEERFSRRIARGIFEYRKRKKIETASELADIVLKAYPKRGHWRIHPATRVFQALRIFVNRELEEIQTALEKSVKILGYEGKLVIISYHSLEDRLVKNFFKGLPRDEFKILTKKPLSPSPEEVNLNRRSRSAKMRVIMKVIK